MRIKEGKRYITTDGTILGPFCWKWETTNKVLIPNPWGVDAVGYGHLRYNDYGSCIPKTPGMDLAEEVSVQEEKSDYKKWRDMTDEEKGVIALAAVEQRPIEYCAEWEWKDWSADIRLGQPNLKYRLKEKEPEYAISTHEIYIEAMAGRNPEVVNHEYFSTHIIEFKEQNGIPIEGTATIRERT